MACGVEAACHVARASGTGSAAAALVCSSSLQGASLGRNCRVEPPEGSYYEHLAPSACRGRDLLNRRPLLRAEQTAESPYRDSIRSRPGSADGPDSINTRIPDIVPQRRAA